MKTDWRAHSVTPDEVISHIKSNQKLFLHGASATPHCLIDALVKRDDLHNIALYHMHITGDAPFTKGNLPERFRSISLFTSACLRDPIARDDADFIPVFLSDIPKLFSSHQVSLNASLLQLSPPDEHGYCSLGTSVDTARAAADTSKVLLAEINEQMPRTLGNTSVHISKLTAYTCTDRPLSEHGLDIEGPVEGDIGSIVADLVEDGATLQMGIGTIPNAVLSRLGNKVDLGIHTEMFSDGVIPLIENGVITNRKKSVHPGRSVTSFVTGTEKLFRFVHNNPTVQFDPCDRTNDTALIRKNQKVVAINSALQIDLSGQVCADSLGYRIYSGIGGQMDFLRGAALSKGGKPIIALPSTAAGGKISRIVPNLSPGAGVVTTRGHVHWVVTEYGAVNLHGKTLRERAHDLIAISHPDFRSELTREIKEIRHFHF